MRVTFNLAIRRRLRCHQDRTVRSMCIPTLVCIKHIQHIQRRALACLRVIVQLVGGDHFGDALIPFQRAHQKLFAFVQIHRARVNLSRSASRIHFADEDRFGVRHILDHNHVIRCGAQRNALRRIRRPNPPHRARRLVQLARFFQRFQQISTQSVQSPEHLIVFKRKFEDRAANVIQHDRQIIWIDQCMFDRRLKQITRMHGDILIERRGGSHHDHRR